MKKKALFLDRDGVINIDYGHVFRISDFEFVEGIFDLCRHAAKLEYLLFVITNQGGIGRGFYTENDFQNLSKWMKGRFAEEGIRIHKIYHCPYHPEHGRGEYQKESFDRKPSPGMILRAMEEFGLSMEQSFLIGDKETDIEAAINAGIGTSILFKENIKETKADRIIANLKEVLDLL